MQHNWEIHGKKYLTVHLIQRDKRRRKEEILLQDYQQIYGQETVLIKISHMYSQQHCLNVSGRSLSNKKSHIYTIERKLLRNIVVIC